MALLTLIFGQGAVGFTLFKEFVANFANLLRNLQRDLWILGISVLIIREILINIAIGRFSRYHEGGVIGRQ